MFKTPILFLIFNRPDTTQQVFDEIKKQKPRYLFVAADGARSHVVDDKDKCQTTREIVLNNIDWDCEVKTLFRDENLGCGVAVSEAISWFFENVEQGIILEDDSLPHSSFFRYSETLLERYRNDEGVMMISGNNFQKGIVRGDGSYYFSEYAHIWGWATWKKSWLKYDFKMKNWPNFQENRLLSKCNGDRDQYTYWCNVFQKTYEGEIDTWDYQWMFAIWYSGGITILPNVNLISNIGFGNDATHTRGYSPFSNLKTQDIGAILHPKSIKVDKKADRYTSAKVFNIPKNKKLTYKGLKKDLKRKLVRLLSPEIIQLIKRKFRVSQNEQEKALASFPRYTKTTVMLKDREITIPDSASFIFMNKEIFKDEIYRFKTSNKTPYIVDGGANIGLATIYLKLLYPDSNIIAFEPDPEIYMILEENIKTFNFTDVELLQKGIWNDNIILSFSSEGADGGLIADLDKSIATTSKSIEVISLKPYLKKKVDFLKLDIEGAETIVLKDIEDDLIRVDRIFVEYHSFVGQPQTLNEIIDILIKAKFRLYMSIPGNNSLNSPLMGLGNYNNMDFQLNIFGHKEGK
ncbi:FkbM family methyltransferase [Flavobacterium aquidurense]|uniref:FkbM family methyltransferase n=1 Tax=Flavobacterium aquidurense TaxID=362413 RepID=UPI00285E2BC7|nr:FkbM family methyltransferase [Flavobacterium aquidurense]MDR7372333.1 FkbM family methyltransferase [Flavobacterium aquidurense]